MGEVAGKRQRLFAAGECGSENLRGFGCGVECDGGVVHFKPLAGTDRCRCASRTPRGASA